MVEGDYQIKVSVDGVDVQDDKYCRRDHDCVFKTRSHNTPTLTKLTPTSGLPGEFLEISGDIKTTKYGSNLPDEDEDEIVRVYFGGQKCELRNETNDSL
jgi:hypothetical protein